MILIVGILATIAIPALLGQKSKAYDSSAKTLAQTAQSTAETYATENSGFYSFTEPPDRSVRASASHGPAGPSLGGR